MSEERWGKEDEALRKCGQHRSSRAPRDLRNGREGGTAARAALWGAAREGERGPEEVQVGGGLTRNFRPSLFFFLSLAPLGILLVKAFVPGVSVASEGQVGAWTIKALRRAE